ncbi:MAG: gamma-glutamylcyclotransferase [Geminicoccaceae bacterium]
MSEPISQENLDWVFAYGSLMWNPEFSVKRRLRGRLHGDHRALCIYSWHHRGTETAPGLVLGLDRGGACRGHLLGFREDQRAEVIRNLDLRELTSAVYERRRVPVQTTGGPLMAWAYVVVRNHEQYAGKLSDGELLALIRQGNGGRGRCTDYVLSTADHLHEEGIYDPILDRLAKHLRPQEKTSNR